MVMAISSFELEYRRRFPDAAGSLDDDNAQLLPTAESSSTHHQPISARQITDVALKIKVLVDTIIPIEIKESRITRPGSANVITDDVIKLALDAAKDSKGCIIFAILTVHDWYKKIGKLELFDADLYALKCTACERIAKLIIENEEDQEFLFKQMLCRRYSTVIDGGEDISEPRSAIELAIDIHCVAVIGSSGYQRCIDWIWRGWLIPNPHNTSEYMSYKNVADVDFWAHFDPDRIKTPLYQNGLQLFISILYLALYSGAVNTANPGGTFDPVEGLLYIITLGYIADEINKFYHIGIYYFSFWSVFNDTLYSLLVVSFIFRLIALASPDGSHTREVNDILAYRFLAFCAPLVWSRLLLYLDTQKFFGAMLVVLKELMKESAVFFVLLIIIMVGFLQAFVGLDSADGYYDVGSMSLAYMVRSVLGSPEFEPYEFFAAPFGALLNYLFTFVVSVLLLNILIALFNSAYEKVYDNAIDEFMALFAGKTLRFVRAPDENVFVPPLNLIEITMLISPFEWWMSRERYARLNDIVMLIVYSPVLAITASYEVIVAKRIVRNRAIGEEDDDVRHDWEDANAETAIEESGWSEKVEKCTPHAELEPGMFELLELRKEVAELTKLVKALKSEMDGGSNSKSLKSASVQDTETETDTLLDVSETKGSTSSSAQSEN
ncbi:uncharacterized protein V1516DRAFT_677511 [Lipomyces oligophaga]|uniref:uncharacterized protein n=1 Tax=Lipomyces oligophaga TaxID=45792 RepID=UPI0034CD71C6